MLEVNMMPSLIVASSGTSMAGEPGFIAFIIFAALFMALTITVAYMQKKDK